MVAIIIGWISVFLHRFNEGIEYAPNILHGYEHTHMQTDTFALTHAQVDSHIKKHTHNIH